MQRSRALVSSFLRLRSEGRADPPSALGAGAWLSDGGGRKARGQNAQARVSNSC